MLNLLVQRVSKIKLLNTQQINKSKYLLHNINLFWIFHN